MILVIVVLLVFFIISWIVILGSFKRLYWILDNIQNSLSTHCKLFRQTQKSFSIHSIHTTMLQACQSCTRRISVILIVWLFYISIWSTLGVPSGRPVINSNQTKHVSTNSTVWLNHSMKSEIRISKQQSLCLFHFKEEVNPCQRKIGNICVGWNSFHMSGARCTLLALPFGSSAFLHSMHFNSW